MTARSARLSTLVEGSNVRPLAVTGADPLIRGASLDSRRVEPGDVFFAIRGLHANGEAFVPDAIRRGALAVIAESPPPTKLDSSIGWVQVTEARRAAGPLSRECYGRPDEALELVGVTGTNGKTTVTYLVESIARAAGRGCGRIGTVGFGLEGEERPLERTTPEAPDLYRLLAEMRERSIDIVAMEVSSHALALHRVEDARFAVAAFLNLSPDHLDFHGDEPSYFAAKARLFASLGGDRWAVLPADSPYGERLASRTKARTLTFGRSATAEVRLRDERCGLDGSSAVLETPSGTVPVRTFLPGRMNLDNVAAAAACALALDLAPESIPAGVLALEGVPGRMERIDAGQPFTVIVDYAHTAAALEAALAWVREVGTGRVLVVFGCGGERDTGKRSAMGRVAARAGDLVVLTSDNPRGEDPRHILDQIAEGVATVPGATERCRTIVDRASAIRQALAAARAGDVVVIAGKGHETRQDVGDLRLAFDDRLVARAALAKLGWQGERGARA
jgi:UDP-N-acetylmuramoyl-L-alanyl-D-glutamate--2,6-diaminopimelate ligase